MRRSVARSIRGVRGWRRWNAMPFFLLAIAQAIHAQPSFRAAEAQDVTLVNTTMLLSQNAVDVAFSRDGKLLAFVTHQPFTDRGQVGVFDVASVRRVHILELAANFEQVVWSPDGARLLAIAKDLGGYSKGYIIEVASEKAVDIGRLPYRNEVIWPARDTIYFVDSHNPGFSVRFSLESLSSTAIWPGDVSLSINLAELAEKLFRPLRASPSDHPRMTMMLGKVGDCGCEPAVVLMNLDGTYENVVFRPANNIPRAAFSPTGEHFAVIDVGSGGGPNPLLLGRLAVRPRPAFLAIEATVGLLPSVPDPSELGVLQDRVNQGVSVLAFVRSPRRNPLNNRVIGSVGPIKAWVRVVRASGTLVQARVTQELQSLSVGDILTDFQIPSERSLRLNSIQAQIRGTLTQFDAAVPSSAARPAPRPKPSGPDPRILAAADAFDAKKYDEAFRLYRTLSDEGNVDAQRSLGMISPYRIRCPRGRAGRIRPFRESRCSRRYDRSALAG